MTEQDTGVEPKRLFATVREAATMTGWSEDTVRRMIDGGQMPAIRSGPRGSWRIPLAWIRDAATRMGNGESVPAEERRTLDRQHARRKGRQAVRLERGPQGGGTSSRQAGEYFDYRPRKH